MKDLQSLLVRSTEGGAYYRSIGAASADIAPTLKITNATYCLGD
jgi:hypothetical protein